MTVLFKKVSIYYNRYFLCFYPSEEKKGLLSCSDFSFLLNEGVAIFINRNNRAVMNVSFPIKDFHMTAES